MYPGTSSIPNVVDQPPTGNGEREEFVIWRKRRTSDQWFKMAVLSTMQEVEDEMDNEANAADDTPFDPDRYRLVRVVIRETATVAEFPA